MRNSGAAKPPLSTTLARVRGIHAGEPVRDAWLERTVPHKERTCPCPPSNRETVERGWRWNTVKAWAPFGILPGAGIEEVSAVGLQPYVSR